MPPWLVLLLVAGCFLALWLYNRREQALHGLTETEVIKSLALTRVVLFPSRADDDPAAAMV